MVLWCNLWMIRKGMERSIAGVGVHRKALHPAGSRYREVSKILIGIRDIRANPSGGAGSGS